jgi:acetyl esterase/lipase
MLTLVCAVGTVTPAHGQSERARNTARIAQEVATIPFTSYGAHKEQTFDVYVQKRVVPGSDKAPIIVMVHGGAWRMGDKAARGVVQNKVERWVPNGFVLVSVDYRLLPEANPLEQAQDVALALARIQARAPEWNADGTKVILMGHSAGGHLVSLLSANPQIAYSLGAMPWLGTVSLDSAALDIEAIMRAPHSRLYDDAFGAKPNPLWRQASPTAMLNANARPTLLVCATKRRTDSCDAARTYEGRVNALGVRAEVVEVDLDHMQINSLLGEWRPYTRRVERFMATLDPLVASRLEK